MSLSIPQRLGVVCWSWNSDSGTSRIIWISSSGSVVMDETVPGGVGIYPVILNERQLMLAPGDRLWLLSREPSGNTTVKLYELPQRQARAFPINGEPELRGFYTLDQNAWTLTRVEFPPPPGPTLSATMRLQTSDQPKGPWTALSETVVPTDKAREFFRLEVSR